MKDVPVMEEVNITELMNAFKLDEYTSTSIEDIHEFGGVLDCYL